MLVYSDALAKALASHKFTAESGTSFQTCTDCGIKVPKSANSGSYQVAKVSPCPGPRDGESDVSPAAR